jgi:hypothetical protein
MQKGKSDIPTIGTMPRYFTTAENRIALLLIRAVCLNTGLLYQSIDDRQGWCEPEVFKIIDGSFSLL